MLQGIKIHVHYFQIVHLKILQTSFQIWNLQDSWLLEFNKTYLPTKWAHVLQQL
jgi:hypothetical protein